MYQNGKANVRIHGSADQKKIHNALTTFIKKVEQKKKNGGKHND